MNENIDLTKILDGCPVGTEFYSLVHGTVRFLEILDINTVYPIAVTSKVDKGYFTKGGRYFADQTIDDECILVPSKYQRDWSKFERFWDKPKIEKFDVKTLRPFDKVLVRSYMIDKWMCDFFSYIDNTKLFPIMGSGLMNKMCIPYNDDTKHLIGTTNDCPEYYKWWEK